jgi:leucyl aminopeptidase
MQFEFLSRPEPPRKKNLVFLARDLKSLPSAFFSSRETGFMAGMVKKYKKELFSFNRLDHWVFVQLIKKEANEDKRKENSRKSGDILAGILNEQKIGGIVLFDAEGNPAETLALAEGIALGNYQFLKYRKNGEKKNTLEKITIGSASLTGEEVRILGVVTDAVYRCRDLVNEPNSYLNAVVLSNEILKMGREAGVKVEVMNRKKIETLKMGGILAVNKGSHEPPTFTVMEWKPAKAGNRKPVVLVGKGIVFDSGGMNLKPGDSMTTMKCDMSGAAAVASAICAVAKARIPVRVIGLIPATDNRPGPEAVVPGDVITMHNGMTVEVLNTDAEGRLILADALSYAKKYDPALVIDLSTLTGSAARAIGKYGIVAMESKAEKELSRLKEAGWKVCERIVEFPNWDEYGELMKSDLADLKNLGPAEGGAITAGKFLEKFTGYPYIHLDIAGPAFLDTRDSYRGKGGSGVGVRLLFEFIKNF